MEARGLVVQGSTRLLSGKCESGRWRDGMLVSLKDIIPSIVE